MVSRLNAPLIAYRIADRRHALIDGRGAQMFGGRWTSPGNHVVYASLSVAGAMLEVLAYANIGRLPRHHVSMTMEMPKGMAVEEVKVQDAPGWERADLRAARRCGDDWLERGHSAVLIVPYVVARTDRNVIINLDHTDARRIRPGRPQPVVWDRRLKQLFS